MIDNVRLALISIGENRNYKEKVIISTDMDKIRSALYKLYIGHWKEKIWDMGHIPKGSSPEDTIYALEQVSK